MRTETTWDGSGEYLLLGLHDTDELCHVAFGGAVSMVDYFADAIDEQISTGAMLDALAEAGVQPGFVFEVLQAVRDEATLPWGEWDDVDDIGIKNTVQAILLGAIWNGPGHESNGEITYGDYVVRAAMDEPDEGLMPRQYIDVVWNYVTNEMDAGTYHTHPFTYETFKAAWLTHNSYWWGN